MIEDFNLKSAKIELIMYTTKIKFLTNQERLIKTITVGIKHQLSE